VWRDVHPLRSKVPPPPNTENHGRAMDNSLLARSNIGWPAQFSGFFFFIVGHYPQPSFGPAQDAGGKRHHRAPVLRGAPAASRVCSYREGSRPSACSADVAGLGTKTYELSGHAPVSAVIVDAWLARRIWPMPHPTARLQVSHERRCKLTLPNPPPQAGEASAPIVRGLTMLQA